MVFNIQISVEFDKRIHTRNRMVSASSWWGVFFRRSYIRRVMVLTHTFETEKSVDGSYYATNCLSINSVCRSITEIICDKPFKNGQKNTLLETGPKLCHLSSLKWLEQQCSSRFWHENSFQVIYKSFGVKCCPILKTATESMERTVNCWIFSSSLFCVQCKHPHEHTYKMAWVKRFKQWTGILYTVIL